MQVQSVNGQSFKGLQCHPNFNTIEYVIATKTGQGSFFKASELMDKLSEKKAYTELYLGGELTKNPKIYAEVGGKIIKESFLFGPVSVLRKALKIANKLQ